MVSDDLADDEIEGLAHGLDTLELFFFDGHVELFLEGHDQLHEVEAVGVERERVGGGRGAEGAGGGRHGEEKFR